MIRTIRCLSFIAGITISIAASAATFTIEPDNYASGTDLTHIIPQVTLLTAVSSDNQTVISAWFISAITDSYSSTGSNTFGYLNFPSLWDGRRMRMDFSNPVSAVSIDFIGSVANDSGELHIFDSAWNELGSGLLTGTLAPHQVQTMSLTRGAADIAHAVAYTHSTGFGRLDNLQFTMVPEPGWATLSAAAATAFWVRRRKQ